MKMHVNISHDTQTKNCTFTIDNLYYKPEIIIEKMNEKWVKFKNCRRIS